MIHDSVSAACFFLSQPFLQGAVYSATNFMGSCRRIYAWLKKEKAWAWVDNKRSIIWKEHYLFHSKMAPEAGAGRVISATIFLSRLRLTLTSEQTRFAILQFLFMPGAPKGELKLAYKCVFTTCTPAPNCLKRKKKLCEPKTCRRVTKYVTFWEKKFQREKSKKNQPAGVLFSFCAKRPAPKKFSARELCHYFL